MARFASRAHFASWNGTAPIDASSGDQNRHRLSRAGNRRINRALHIMAVFQLRRDTEGRRYYRHKLSDGKTSMEAMRALKRRLSDIVYCLVFERWPCNPSVLSRFGLLMSGQANRSRTSRTCSRPPRTTSVT
uniref:transposase n=1 Tax=Actinoplanes xinjiangensis TaxID=512350 RepID=UPI001EF224E0|nr:transposase [Actinoplanes xinjiangensis]